MAEMPADTKSVYSSTINRIGYERELNDKLNFRDEMHVLVFGDNLDAVMSDMGAKSALNASQREWDYYIASIDPESAAKIASATAKDEAKTAMIGAAGSLAKVGVDAASSANDKGTFDSDYQRYKDSGGDDSYAKYSKAYDTGGINTNPDSSKNIETVESSYGGVVT